MNFGVIRSVIGKILILIAILMLVPLIVSFVYQEGYKYYLSFIIPILVLLVIGYLISFKKPKKTKIFAKEGFIIVGLTWLIISLLGCIPFVIAPSLSEDVKKIDYITAFFEIASGFTTTGSSALTTEQLDNMAHSLLFFRSFSHWIGGMGVLVFILALIPESDDGSSVHILRAESPGPQAGKLVSRMKATSRILYTIYIVLTLCEFILLIVFPSSWHGAMSGINGSKAGVKGNDTIFNALCLTFGTAGTGGFAPFSAGCGILAKPAQYVIASFMLIFGINFSIYYYLLIRNYKEIIRNEELRFYLIIVILAITAIFINTYSIYDSVEETFRYSFFTVTSIISTTGYSTVDYISTVNGWPVLSVTIIIILTCFGACAGSTAGGMKISRIIIVGKASNSKIKSMVSPRRVESIRLDGKPLNETTINEVFAYIIVYFILLFSCALIISIYNPRFDNLDFETVFTSSLTCLSNVGPGLGHVGPAGNFSLYSGFSKIVLAIEMIAGRLELFPILIIFYNRTWKRY